MPLPEHSGLISYVKDILKDLNRDLLRERAPPGDCAKAALISVFGWRREDVDSFTIEVTRYPARKRYAAENASISIFGKCMHVDFRSLNASRSRRSWSDPATLWSRMQCVLHFSPKNLLRFSYSNSTTCSSVNLLRTFSSSSRISNNNKNTLFFSTDFNHS